MNTDERGWPKRPRRARHFYLGWRQTWLRSDGRAKIERFLGGTRRYIASVRTHHASIGDTFAVIGDFSSLARAQRACERKFADIARWPRRNAKSREKGSGFRIQMTKEKAHAGT